MNRIDLPDGVLQRIRDDLGIPNSFPAEVLEAAEVAALRIPLDPEERANRSNYSLIPFVTIDPEGSYDLDQAFYAQRSSNGFFVLYAIADVGYFVDRGGPIEEEAWRRGETMYGADTQTLLYPPVLSKGAASLLPGMERPCVLFSFSLDERGRRVAMTVEPSIIRNHAKLDYIGVGEHLEAELTEPGTGSYAGTPWAASLGLLEEIGRLRQQLEVDRGGVSLPIAAQHVRPWSAALEGYRLAFRSPDDVEGWNAQISLMTGIGAARLMIDNEVGLLRVLDPPRKEKLDALRLTAHALGIAWPNDWSYAEFIRSLDPEDPTQAAVIFHAAGVMGGARYEAFQGDVSEAVPHAAIATYYAHVTAPLRRLADRYVLDLLVGLSTTHTVDPGLAKTLRDLPPVMLDADQRARRLEARTVDVAEAKLLAPYLEETFQALIVRLRTDRITVQIMEPPVRADIDLRPMANDHAADETALDDETNDDASVRVGLHRFTLGESLLVRLESVDPQTGSVRFLPVLDER